MQLQNTPVDITQLARARERFLLEGDEGLADSVSPLIRRSWSRCRDFQLHDEINPQPQSVLAELRESASLFLRCSQPELTSLSEHVGSHGCVVTLSDSAGLLFEVIGSAEFLPKARRLTLSPGVSWSEGGRGTNAIGTALAEAKPVLIRGPEHLMEMNGSLGCAASPIFTSAGQLAGALDISGEFMSVDVHAMGLVRMAATQIENRMLSTESTDDLVHFHPRAHFLNTLREGLISVFDGRICGLNRVAAELFRSNWNELLGRSIEEVFDHHWGRLRGANGIFNAPHGEQWAVTVDTKVRKLFEACIVPEARNVQPKSVRPTTILDRLTTARTQALRVLDSGLSVLIRGETGSGKDVFVRDLHAASRRAKGPLVAVNCAALPDTLIESELFGYEEGAFTGAKRKGFSGRLREAHSGIVFLDEIGDMPLALQARLLRVIEDRRVRPLGSSHELVLDFDLVCATHRNLKELVSQGAFREDLYYRIRGFEVVIPALRERPDIHAFISGIFSQIAGEKGVILSQEAMSLLCRHSWPGNTRELVSVLRSAVVLADPRSELTADAMLALLQSNVELNALATVDATHFQTTTIAALAKGALEQALVEHRGNVSSAAASLGVHRSTVYRHIARGNVKAPK